MSFSIKDVNKINEFLDDYDNVTKQGICLAILSEFLREENEDKREALFATFCLTLAKNGIVKSVLEE